MILLFGLMAIGFIGNKTGIMDQVSEKKFSQFIVNISIPATIINSTIGQSTENKAAVFQIMAVAAGVFIFIPIVSTLLTKILKIERTYELMLNYSNLGFMGIPLVLSVYGEEYVLYVSVFMMVFNISLFSHGISILHIGNKKNGINIKKLLNPGILAAFIAIIIFMFKIPIPALLSNIISNIGSSTTPLAMIVIGSTLANVKIIDVLKDKMIYVYTILRLIVYPLLAFVILRMFINDPIILGITVMLIGLPTAGNISMVCAEYNGNVELVTKGLCMSTIFSLVTIPIIMLVVK